MTDRTNETLPGTYVPSPMEWVRDQVQTYERTGGQEGNTLLDTGIPVIIITMRGAKTGDVRKIALMRVEHRGEYALVASAGGAPKHPVWYWNLTAHPDEVLIQDGPKPFRVSVREVKVTSVRNGGTAPSPCTRPTPTIRTAPTACSPSSWRPPHDLNRRDHDHHRRSDASTAGSRRRALHPSPVGCDP